MLKTRIHNVAPNAWSEVKATDSLRVRADGDDPACGMPKIRRDDTFQNCKWYNEPMAKQEPSLPQLIFGFLLVSAFGLTLLPRNLS